MSGSLFPISTIKETSSDGRPGSANEEKKSTGSDFNWLKNQSYLSVSEQNVPEDSGIPVGIEDKVDELLKSVRNEATSGSSSAKDTKLRRKNESRRQKKEKVDFKKAPPDEKHSVKYVFLEDVRLPPEKAFRIDRKRDQNNMAFTSLYNLHIAAYDKSKVLNAKKCQDQSKRKKAKVKRYFETSTKSSENVHLIEPKISRISSCSYIPLCSFELSKPESLSGHGVYDHATYQYVHGKGLVDEPTDEPMVQFSSLSDDAGKHGPRHMSSQQILYEKTQDFNRYLREKPTDINKWIEYVHFQDKAMTNEKNQDNSLDRSILQNAICNKKLSIVEKALEHNPKSVQLGVMRLEILKEFSTFDKVAEEWNKFVFIHPNSPVAWHHFIMFTHSNITFFTVPNVIKTFLKCLSTYRKMLEGHFQSHKAPMNLEEEILKIILMFTVFLENVGHVERAVASWQALIEFNLYTPSHLTPTMQLQDWFAFFEPFWDSGVPRFGEEDAKGWSQVMQDKLTTAPRSSEGLDSLEDAIIAKRSSRSDTWLSFENLRDSYYWLSSSSDETDYTDNVDFDDIEPILFRFRIFDSKLSLVLYFLKYLGASPTHSFIPEIYISRMQHLLSANIPCVAVTSHAPKHKYFEFVLRVFNSSFKVFNDNQQELCRNYIDYQVGVIGSLTSAKEVRKTLKSMLKSDSTNLFLWELYAEFEQRQGKLQDALKVYEVSIRAQQGKSNRQTFYKFLKNYVQVALCLPDCENIQDVFSPEWLHEKTDNNFILRILLEGILGKSFDIISPAVILKCKMCLLSEPSENPALTTILLSFVHSLNHGHEEAFRTLENFLSGSTFGSDEEMVFEVYVKLMLLHWRRRFIRSNALLDVLQRAMARYSANDFFILVFINMEVRSALSFKMRKHFVNILNSSEFRTPRTWMLAIYSELKRLEFVEKGITKDEASTFTNRALFKVRSLCEKAVSCTQSKHSALLWRLYIGFEMKYGLKERAKAIYYRALQSCPWVKDLYKDGIMYFPETLQETLDVMNEKEIRIRAPIEEVDLLMENLVPSEATPTELSDSAEKP